MFLNPTSATLGRGQLAVLYCVLVFDQDDEFLAGHQGTLAYGVTDRIEVGAAALTLDEVEATTLRGGPFLRVKILEERAWPELSAGAILREGNDRLSRGTVFLTASKYLATGDDVVRGIPLHAGLRSLWQAEGEDAVIGFLGGEIELPRGLFLVAEVSNRSDVFEHTPFSFGLQVRRPDGFGFSLAGVQAGDQDALGVLVGIGISFAR
jgi:hypothetical protein